MQKKASRAAEAMICPRMPGIKNAILVVLDSFIWQILQK
jgi:hypothetical protein